MNLNDLLLRENIDPKTVLVLRHAPGKSQLRKLRKMLPSLAASKPAVFNAYQQAQKGNVEKRMQHAKHVAAFLGHEPKKAMFVGLYSVKGFELITKKEFWEKPVNIELKEYVQEEDFEDRNKLLWFDLVLEGFYAHRKFKLVVGWPPKE